MSDQTNGVVIPPLPPKLYNKLKFIAQIVLPALATLYFGLAQTWHLPNATEVVGTITSIDTFLGVILGLSSVVYNKSDAKYGGTITVQPTADEEDTDINVKISPDQLHKKEIVVRVDHKRPKPYSSE